MNFFFSKLHPPRADFGATMTPAEGQLMQQHVAYLSGFLSKGWVVAFGPVAAKEGLFGVAIWSLPEGTDLPAILADDPLSKAAAGFRYEAHPMPRCVTRGV